MSTLPAPLRRQLETAIKQARKIAEGGARKALEALAVHEPEPYRHMDGARRDLRRKLRAQAKQLGDVESTTRRGAYEVKHLVEKLAYDQWHRLLFARFLMENNLLISPEHGVSVTLDDCEELSPSLGLKDAWAVAARFAARELPEIFRADEPAGAVDLPVEDRKPLIQFVTGLPVEVFTASDSLGWCYQFWQAERKDEVNARGNKIGADELSAVTQLFTEDYMVDFLLDNTLGAWHAGKVLSANSTLAEALQSEEELRSATALPDVPWKYMRFIKAQDGKWTPAAGTFDGWPNSAKDLKCLDPCMGSGHFVVAMFERLVALRMADEGLDEPVAVAAVIRDNLFGLEIDPRCTQIGAFNLALAAWRRVGHRPLPTMNLACSGLAPNAKKEDWLKLADDNDRLQRGMARLHALFNDAPVLGSLIDPRATGGDLVEADFYELQPLLEKALAQERDDTAHEMAVTARGLAKAAEILAGQFTLVGTNVPYLGRGKQDDMLKDYCERAYPEGKAELATCFVERCISFCAPDGSIALVTPQNWLFLGTFADLRREVLSTTEWPMVVRLGAKGFQTPMWDFGVALNLISKRRPSPDHRFCGIDVGALMTPDEKAIALQTVEYRYAIQSRQLHNPDAMLSFAESSVSTFLTIFARCYQGTSTSDSPRLTANFWELAAVSGSGWEFLQTPPSSTGFYAGKEFVVNWSVLERGVEGAVIRGADAWSRTGIAFGQMANLPVTLFHGTRFADSAPVLVPFDYAHLLPIWEFCASGALNSALRTRRRISAAIMAVVGGV